MLLHFLCHEHLLCGFLVDSEFSHWVNVIKYQVFDYRHFDIMTRAGFSSRPYIIAAVIVLTVVLSGNLFAACCGIVAAYPHLVSTISAIHQTGQRQCLTLFVTLALADGFFDLAYLIPQFLSNYRLMRIFNYDPILGINSDSFMILIGNSCSFHLCHVAEVNRVVQNITHLTVAPKMVSKSWIWLADLLIMIVGRY